MDQSTQQATARRATRRGDRRYHTDPEFDFVLSVFIEQGNERLGPAFVAYELDLTTKTAEILLDEMVKRSLLDLDFDDDGNLYYSLNPDVLFEMEQHAAAQDAFADTRRSPSRWLSPDDHQPSIGHSGAQLGFDGTVGQPSATSAPPRSRQQHHHRQAHSDLGDPDGCDGTVGHPGDRPRRPVVSEPRRQAYGDRGQDRGVDARRDDVASPKGELIRHDQSDNLPARRRNAEPMVAALLSVLLVGTGQIYNRDVGKGIAFFVVYAVLLTTFYPVGWMVNVWAAVDAYSSAKRRNAELGKEQLMDHST